MLLNLNSDRDEVFVIRATGLGSGLISMDWFRVGFAEGDPAVSVSSDETRITSEISAFSLVNSSLRSLMSASDVLNTSTAFEAQTVNSQRGRKCG